MTISIHTGETRSTIHPSHQDFTLGSDITTGVPSDHPITGDMIPSTMTGTTPTLITVPIHITARTTPIGEGTRTATDTTIIPGILVMDIPHNTTGMISL